MILDYKEYDEVEARCERNKAEMDELYKKISILQYDINADEQLMDDYNERQSALDE